MASTTDKQTSSVPSCTPSYSLSDALKWKNPVTTGCILGAINVSFFLFAVLDYSVCTLACHAALFFMVFGLIISLLLKSTPDFQKVEIVSKRCVEENILWIYDIANQTAAHARRVILWHDMTKSLKVVVFLFLFGWVSSWISLAAMFFIGTWILFTHVFVMDVYHAHLEDIVRPHISTAYEFMSVAYSKIPRMADTKKID